MLVGGLVAKLGRPHAQVRSDDTLGSVTLAQGGNEFGTNLAKCPGNQDAVFHRLRLAPLPAESAHHFRVIASKLSRNGIRSHILRSRADRCAEAME